MASPMSFASTCAAPVERTVSSTRWASTARSESVTGRPWHALRTPLMIFSRLNGTTTPLRLMTFRLAVSVVLKRRPHSGHWRRRLMATPSSEVRESTTRESGYLQYGQYMVRRVYRSIGARKVRRAVLGRFWAALQDG